MEIAEPWRDRSTWSATGRCPIEAAMALLGSRAAILLLREAYYGTRRFDAFVDRVDIAPATAATHLRALTEAGLLTRQPYRPADGGRVRDEYVLTQAGTDFFPVIVGLFDWGRRYTDAPSVLELAHADCDAPIASSVTCLQGHCVDADHVVLRSRTQSGKRRRPTTPKPGLQEQPVR